MSGVKLARRMGVLLAVAVVGCGKTVPEEVGPAMARQPMASTWQQAAPLPEQRTLHAAAVLPTGKVLITGGWSYSSYLETAVVYDPEADGWSATGSMGTPRLGHTATVLSSGRVLVTGGENAAGYTASAELYDPATGSWSPAGATSQPRGYNTATRLASGKVLVAGGLNPGGAWETVDVYDPVAGTWARAAPLGTPRRSHTATLLPSGKLLVAGGWGGGATQTAELYDPATERWSPTGSLAMARFGHTATLLPSGRVLVAGGRDGSGAMGTAELYDPATGTWSATGSLGTARFGHTAALLPSGRVLVAGGQDTSGALASAEEYDPATGTWSAAGFMAGARYDHTVSVLEPAGKVLVTGGKAGPVLLTAELYTSACGTGTCSACVSQPGGLVHWWRAEDDARDAIGAKHGTAVGGAAHAAGQVGRAFLLDGMDDHIALPRITLGAFAGLTYEAWVQTTSTDATSTYAGNAALNILGDTANSVWIGFGVHGGKVRYTRAVSGSTWANVTGRLPVNDGAWHHIAVTHDTATGNIALYVDGALDVTGRIPWERTNAAVDLLGAGYGLRDRFDGRIDEVSIYNRVLRPEELAALHAARAGKCAGAM